MECDTGSESEPSLSTARFIEVYRWIVSNLPDDICARFDRFIDEELAAEYPSQVVEVYDALARDEDSNLRVQAAIGIHNVVKLAPEEGLRLAQQLLDDEDAAVAAQARETLRDLPHLLSGSPEEQ